jgi:protein-S-isoprenylcysteine O-methyltransferase Ste14
VLNGDSEVGQALVFGSASLLGYAAVVWAVFHLSVQGYEQPTLRRQFDESYTAYRRDVRRWWPRIRPWVPPPPDGSARHGSPAG